ncbi:Sporulation related domain-containing protein [Thiothrix caldifontis]|uniref:Sporulation related domain-containing protein n=1 Tax=Thiothrix caldifontis TaxID=525918 RepID=A0A1H4GY95_9GAMM|nr:SPOR domain-containing protein [Thiothrix caldifontis]SEB14517.1 Sporulation related domain-containing protein [Thiothrix caldifontis]
MKYLIAAILLFTTTHSYADCVFGLDNVSNVGGVKDILRCLQDEINAIKGEESDNQTPTNNRRYTIQIMATSNASHAKEVQETFKTFGYDSFIKPSLNTANKNKPIWYKVMVGNYQWESEAAQNKSTLILNHPLYKDSFVTSIVFNND